jgi:hypothetical protein
MKNIAYEKAIAIKLISQVVVGNRAEEVRKIELCYKRARISR